MTIFVYAAPKEAGRFADDPRVVPLGVGKVATTLALTRRLLASRASAVISFGVAGAHPGGPAIGDACMITTDWLADEGVITPEGFLGIEQMKLGTRGPFATDPSLDAWLESRLGPLPRMVGATVSTCSGTRAQAELARAAVPSALVETMEGAAVGAVCTALGVPWAQLRVISNRTGDRDQAGWDLPRALATLHDALAHLLDA